MLAQKARVGEPQRITTGAATTTDGPGLCNQFSPGAERYLVLVLHLPEEELPLQGNPHYFPGGLWLSSGIVAAGDLLESCIVLQMPLEVVQPLADRLVGKDKEVLRRQYNWLREVMSTVGTSCGSQG